MLLLKTFVAVSAVASNFAAAKPLDKDKQIGRVERDIERRQDVDGDDIETDAATDQLRDAIDYASVFSAQPTVTYSAVSTGAATSDARLVATTTLTPGNNAVGSPPDSSEQGTRYVVDHILELQFAVGAFQINPRPTTGATSIPIDKWNSASQACFSSTRNYPAQTSVASAFSNAFNLQGIPARFNGFKQQVFTGRLKSQPGNPSDRTYPSDFGSALQDFLVTNEQGAYAVMDDVGKILANENVGNYSAIKDYFTAYAQGEWQSAITFLSTWSGTSYTGSPATTTTAVPTTTANAGTITSAPDTAIPPLTGCSYVQTTETGTIISPGVYSYCQCGDVIAGINTETSGNLLYSVCAGTPYPTIATGTITTPPAQPTPTRQPTCDCNENGCTPESPGCCGNGTCDQDGTCNTPNCD